MKRIFLGFILTLLLTVVFATPSFAHVVVGPDKVGLATRQDFSIGVPNEKEVPTTEIRLVLPEGLESVTPYVKPGWEIETKKTGEGEETKVTEITWKSGSISVGLRDAFIFRAMTPSDPTTLIWKAYQTYSDGTVVSWDQAVKDNDHEEESETAGPYSETSVVNDLSVEPAVAKSKLEEITPMIAAVALLLSALGLGLQLRKKA